MKRLLKALSSTAFSITLVVSVITTAAAAHAEEFRDLLTERGFVAIKLEENRFGHFVAHGELNDHKISVLIDSGASATVIDSAFVAELKLSTHSSAISAVGLGGSQGLLQIVDLDQFSLGTQRLDANGVKVMNLDHINRIYRSHSLPTLSAIIGADYLKAHSAILDYNNGQLWLKPLTI